MAKVRVSAFTMSIDGFGAGPDQSLENPLGVGGTGPPQWYFPTKSFNSMFGKGKGTTGLDNDLAEKAMENVGAWIMGRNMFGPVRGPWPDFEWKGWWGPNPPYHVPVFVLTHYPRPPLEMEGNNVFHFVTGGIDEALSRAKTAAKEKDVRIGGGAATVRQYLKASLIDEMHIPVSPVLLGSGEPLLAGLDLKALGYECSDYVPSSKAAHMFIKRAHVPL
jgi:dihydrofolate reductase